MGATQSSNHSNAGNFSNNQHAVASLLAEYQKPSSHSGMNLSSLTSSSTTPPPSCPMHNKASVGGSDLPPTQPRPPKMPASSAGQCPIPHDQRDSYMASQQQARSPTGSFTMQPDPSSSTDSATSPWSSSLNPLNMMPSLSQVQPPQQKVQLPTERTTSSIPRSSNSPAPGASPYDAASESGCPVKHDGNQQQADRWEYPSPQQFYNALVRKGWETPEEHVETMVLIHNFLNERAWQEVLEWEKLAGADPSKAELARFQGKPGTLTPKARMFGFLGWLMPDRFSSEPPFDRHDWVVRRPDHDGKEVRYVIDYYSVPEDPSKDEAEFNLDVRPALDSFDSFRVRFKKTYDEWKNGQDPITASQT